MLGQSRPLTGPWLDPSHFLNTVIGSPGGLEGPRPVAETWSDELEAPAPCLQVRSLSWRVGVGDEERQDVPGRRGAAPPSLGPDHADTTSDAWGGVGEYCALCRNFDYLTLLPRGREPWTWLDCGDLREGGRRPGEKLPGRRARWHGGPRGQLHRCL